MKITKQQLKQIIKEELKNVLTESEYDRPDLETYKKAMNIADLKKQPGLDSVAQGDDLSQALDPKESEIAKIISFNLESGTVDAAIQQLENAQFLYDDVGDYYQTLTNDDKGIMSFANAILNGMQQDDHPGYHEY